MKRLVLWLPLALFAIFLGTVAIGLYAPSDRQVKSRLIGRELPQFALPQAVPEKPALASSDFGSGEPRILNIFASWCIPCIAEAPQLLAIARRGVPIDAIAIRDRPEDIARFLERHGDPFARIGSDVDSSVQMALGSSGVPETFVIDGQGVIRYQHIGAINDAQVADILAAWEAAR
ncbi:MAG: DsbE family thiol:disulfide interchange protein [Allosphingosinicella sp.]|uniref:DsbE family thiol:disulfide interchange protein n=1 Tax=Allosphingosinicella sp. TaxID=2823234 RepID=UPI00393BC452